MMNSVMHHYSKRYQKDAVAMNCFFTTKTTIGACVVEVEDIKKSSKGYCLSRVLLKQPKVRDLQHMHHCTSKCSQ